MTTIPFKQRPSYDSRCYDLAQVFLEETEVIVSKSEHESRCDELAAEIQQTVEDWMMMNPPKRKTDERNVT